MSKIPTNIFRIYCKAIEIFLENKESRHLRYFNIVNSSKRNEGFIYSIESNNSSIAKISRCTPCN